MSSKIEFYQKFLEEKIVAVVRGKDAKEAAAIAEAAVKGGLNAIELTYTTPGVEDVFKHFAGTNALIGAGTVLDEETARHAILNGAQFVVSPHFDPKIAKTCNRYSIPYFPGCMTIKEMVQAMEYGSDILKLFPANGFDPSFIGSVNGPLPNVRVMPTGGINLNNMNEWLDAGAVAVGIGSDLTKAYRSAGEDAVVKLVQEYLTKLG
ncbi:bifunctional 2-keto-4-hydroxyglutarate aldolase/2-keto-3-deoxy-6-phosphogluconate aldolase [Jeotgalibacillus proteolyticus]|uniref:Bifunctional 2-keto-4-hydroxyglutarate aldolase/2-keto-3-deoxy-6-phosphogluconate aldolase n=1 Tax=Jeotgalibacillus proteolyticus TaxID=2082395 RepID=A0A2S5G824_9BACL|nr:bifunctional 2-keto-4-hydroxyglutarate aldolase/2-keto-3-deoxy-6-phosphogluconate aldolase [Jeotgalibacillus proteolyticus]PPA69130.1 bifunctional 2-keto-4-hydroxyglutarate aldolase/2-keto-3-deoxy-6-phosphogluconate aldolase [Jeotgalibacillus proteolyticus]